MVEGSCHAVKKAPWLKVLVMEALQSPHDGRRVSALQRYPLTCSPWHAWDGHTSHKYTQFLKSMCHIDYPDSVLCRELWETLRP